MDIDLAVEKLSLSGTILVNLNLSASAPFPHATRLSVSFLEKPDVWFSVRILRAVQMMEVPLIKTWIHAVVTDALASWLVDPGHLDMDLRAQERPGPGLDSATTSMPQGVLSVVLCQNGYPGEHYSFKSKLFSSRAQADRKSYGRSVRALVKPFSVSWSGN